MKVARRALAGLAGLAVAVVLAALVLAWHQGYRVYVVHTGSMIPAFRPGEALIDRPVRGPVRRGEIVTFRYAYGPDQVVTHRVFSEARGIIRTKGDANPTKDPWKLRHAQVVGTPIAIVPYGGYVLVYLRQPDGVASVIVFAVLTWLLWGLCFPADAGGSGVKDAGKAAEEPGPRRQARGRHSAPSGGRRALEPALFLPAAPGLPPGLGFPARIEPEPAAQLAGLESLRALAITDVFSAVE